MNGSDVPAVRMCRSLPARRRAIPRPAARPLPAAPVLPAARPASAARGGAL